MEEERTQGKEAMEATPDIGQEEIGGVRCMSTMASRSLISLYSFVPSPCTFSEPSFYSKTPSMRGGQ